MSVSPVSQASVSPLATPSGWRECRADEDRALWYPTVARLYDYWLSIAPEGGLPGRQHLDPIDLGPVLPHLWMLDVLRAGTDDYRYRYRLVGTAEVATLQREVTGRWFDEVHGGPSAIYGRFRHMIENRVGTYRKGIVGLSHHEDHRMVENCMVPLAGDGRSVDIIVCCSVLFTASGEAVH